MDDPSCVAQDGPAKLAAPQFVCYNAGRRQFNKIEPREAGSALQGETEWLCAAPRWVWLHLAYAPSPVRLAKRPRWIIPRGRSVSSSDIRPAARPISSPA